MSHGMGELNIELVRSEGFGVFARLHDEGILNVVHRLPLQSLVCLGCTSKLFALITREEPVWKQHALGLHAQETPLEPLQFHGSWRQTALQLYRRLPVKPGEPKRRPTESAVQLAANPPPRVEGFASDVLYRRWYVCNVDVSNFLPREAPTASCASIDVGQILGEEDDCALAFTVEGEGRHRIGRVKGLDDRLFRVHFDAMQRPVLVTDLIQEWPASTWTPEILVQRYGDYAFKVGQGDAGRVTMRLRDYLAYMAVQHDEDPLYVFDSQFVEVVPTMADEYWVPSIFKEDLFSVLGLHRPQFRWLVVGPARTGASWHVDPALTSAWNALMFGRKRWALYPPGRVPPGVQLEVDEDGEVDTITPSSLQWFLEVYPFLESWDLPIEAVQEPGETIFVPSGWWHCVLNLTDTLALTQNFVSVANMVETRKLAASSCARGTVRRLHMHLQLTVAVGTGMLATFTNLAAQIRSEMLHHGLMMSSVSASLAPSSAQKNVCSDMRAAGRSAHTKASTVAPGKELPHLTPFGFPLGMRARAADPELPLHHGGESLQQLLNATRDPETRGVTRDLRFWFRALWDTHAELRPFIWEAAEWSSRLSEICASNDLPTPQGAEVLAVGSGVSGSTCFVTGRFVIKCYPVEEEEDCVAGGVVAHFDVESWVLDQIKKDGSERLREACPKMVSIGVLGCPPGIPYMITQRSPGQALPTWSLSLNDSIKVAKCIGGVLHDLHQIPYRFSYAPSGSGRASTHEACQSSIDTDTAWSPFKAFLRGQRMLAIERVRDHALMSPQLKEQVEVFDASISGCSRLYQEYLPQDVTSLVGGASSFQCPFACSKYPCCLHGDLTEENIFILSNPSDTHTNVASMGQMLKLGGCQFIDFGDAQQGDALYDFVALHAATFRCAPELLRACMETYCDAHAANSTCETSSCGSKHAPVASAAETNLPSRKCMKPNFPDPNSKSQQCMHMHHHASYRAMCYTLLHDQDILDYVLKAKPEWGREESFHELASKMWGVLDELVDFYFCRRKN